MQLRSTYHIFKKYENVLYSAVRNTTLNEIYIEQILVEIFRGLNQNYFIPKDGKLMIFLIRYAHKTALQFLKEKNIPPLSLTSTHEDYPLMDMIVLKSLPPPEVASLLGISQRDFPKQLRGEVLKFRIKNKSLQ